MNLPDCNELLQTFFSPWYPGEKPDSTKGDMITSDDWIGKKVADLSPLDDHDQMLVIQQLERMQNAASTDWPRFITLSKDIDLSWVDAFDQYYDRERITKLIADSDPKEDGNEYMITCIEFGVILGLVMQKLQPRLKWCAEIPYWESVIFDAVTGTQIPVVHWAIKKLSDYGCEDGFAEKVEACVAILDSPTYDS